MSDIYHEVKQFLKDKKGYRKWSPTRIANKFGFPIGVIEEVREDLKKEEDNFYEYYKLDQKQKKKATDTPNENESESNTDREDEVPETAKEAYKRFLEARGITKEDVHSVKFWQTMNGEPRFSVVHKGGISSVSEEKMQEKLNDLQYDFPTGSRIKSFEADSGNMASVNLTDAHIDKMQFLGEFVSIEENVDVFKQSYVELLSPCLIHNPERIDIMVGSDFWNANDARETTKRGTGQQMNIDWERAYVIGVDVYIWMIETAKKRAPVEVVIVRGNHDEDKVFTLGVTLERVYRDDPNVSVNMSRKPRKYYKWGRNMIGYGHGYHEKKKSLAELPVIMAEEAPKIFCNTDLREFNLGDIHNKEEFSLRRTKEYRGATIRYMRDISYTDSQWDVNHGWHTFPKSAEAFIYNKNRGRIANYSVNI